jgi:signal transduction histidine kinase
MTSKRSRHPDTTPTAVDIRRLIARAVAWPLLLMALVAGWLGIQVERHAQASAALDRAAEVIAAAHAIQRLVLDQETGLRAFLVLDDRAFLKTYEEARPEEGIDALERLVRGTPEETTVDALRSQYRSWHAEAQAAILDPGGGRNPAAMTSRKAEMDGIRTIIAGIVDDEGAMRGRRVRGIDVETRYTGLVSVLLLMGVAVTLAVVSRRILQHVAERYEDALRRSTRSEAALATLVERERDARERAEHASRAKDEFLSTLSHELRTPITAILGWACVLKTRATAPSTSARAIAAIERSAKLQTQIVEDILDASRLVSGKFRLRVATTDVGAVVRAALEVVRFSAESKGISIEVVVDREPIRMVADADRLHQVVWNLLSNAIKFTPRDGHVRIAVGSRDGHVTVEVWDDGEGIAPDFLPHVFERFRQADSSWKRPHGGLGLGLALVKHLVDLHGGDIRAESDGRGRGAVFTVTLPIATAAEAPPRAMSA